MLWFLQRNSPNIFYQFSFLQTRKKRNKLLFLFMALIWNRHLCEHCFLLLLNKTWWKHENMYFPVQSSDTGDERAPDELQEEPGEWIKGQWGMNQGAERAVLFPKGAVCAGCLCRPSWDRAWRGLLCSFSSSRQSSPYCWASETETSWAKIHRILKCCICLPLLFNMHFLMALPSQFVFQNRDFPAHNWWTACRSLSSEPRRTHVAFLSTLSIYMSRYFFFPCYFSFQSAEYVIGI